MEQNSNKQSKVKKINLLPLISTALIIGISIISVISIMMISDTQYNTKYNRQSAEKYSNLLDAFELDMENILDRDSTLQQLSLLAVQEFLLYNQTIFDMKAYNLIHPGTFTQDDINLTCIQAALKIQQINAYIYDTIAYNVGTENYLMNASNQYSYFDNSTQINQSYYLINDLYQNYKSNLDIDLLYWINIINGVEVEILQINVDRWNTLMFSNMSILYENGKFAHNYIDEVMNVWFYTNMSVANKSYYDIAGTGAIYGSTADLYNQAAELFTTTLVLLAISAVIIAFAIQIFGRKYRWISIIIGIAVTLIGIWMFTQGLLYMDLAFLKEPILGGLV